MPYIEQGDRDDIDLVLEPLLDTLDSTNPGEINYVVTRIITNRLRYDGPAYHIINELVGVLECAKLELYRRLAAPYEDRKLEENGDVY